MGISKITAKGMILFSSAGIIMNMILAFAANLITIPPLDDSNFFLGFSPARFQSIMLLLERFGFLIVIALLYFGILDPVIDFLQMVILSLIKTLLPL